MTHADNTPHLLAAAAARHDAARQRARRAITDLDRTREAINFTAVAHTAHVSRGWLYNQTDLRDTIIALRQNSTAGSTLTPVAERSSAESFRQRLDTARDEISRLRAENTALHLTSRDRIQFLSSII